MPRATGDFAAHVCRRHLWTESFYLGGAKQFLSSGPLRGFAGHWEVFSSGALWGPYDVIFVKQYNNKIELF